MIDSARERRQLPRQFSCANLFIRTLDEPRLTITCLACDISARGLKIRTAQTVATGRPVELWIKLNDQPGTFLLNGRIRWSETGTDGHVLGIELDEAEQGIDAASWRALLMPLPET